jgi:hypothetical protein
VRGAHAETRAGGGASWRRPEDTEPTATSFKVQLYEDGWAPVDGVNAVLDGIRLVSNPLSIGQLKVHRSCKGLIEDIPGYSWSEGTPSAARTSRSRSTITPSTRSATE